MSSGNRVVDGRVAYNNGLSVVNWGPYRSKVWSGGDQPTSTVVKKTTPTPQYRKVPFSYTKNGRTVTGERIVKIPTVSSRGPKRTLRKNRGEHAYEVTILSEYEPLGDYKYTTADPWRKWTLSSLWGKYSVPVSENTAGSDLYQKNLTKLRDAIAGSDFNAAVCLAEGPQSLAMIANSAKRISSSLNHLKRGNFASAARSLGIEPTQKNLKAARRLKKRSDLAGLWLELQYGWKPLVQDAYSAAQYLGQTGNAPLTRTYRVRSKRETLVTSASPTNIRFSNASCVDRYQIVARVSSVDLVSLSGLTDPASVVWEKLPYSFVIDWFLPIGSYLQNLALARSVTGTFVLTFKREINCSNPYYVGPTVGGTAAQGFDNTKYFYKHMIRAVSTTLFVPKPVLKTPSSLVQALNALALLSNLKKG